MLNVMLFSTGVEMHVRMRENIISWKEKATTANEK